MRAMLPGRWDNGVETLGEGRECHQKDGTMNREALATGTECCQKDGTIGCEARAEEIQYYQKVWNKDLGSGVLGRKGDIPAYKRDLYNLAKYG